MGIFIIDCVYVIWCYVLNVFEFIGDNKVCFLIWVMKKKFLLNRLKFYILIR